MKNKARKYYIYLEPNKRERLDLRQIGERLGIGYSTIRRRVAQYGFKCEKVFFIARIRAETPPSLKIIPICLDGKKIEYLQRYEIAERLGIKYSTLQGRINRNSIDHDTVYNPNILQKRNEDTGNDEWKSLKG